MKKKKMMLQSLLKIVYREKLIRKFNKKNWPSSAPRCSQPIVISSKFQKLKLCNQICQRKQLLNRLPLLLIMIKNQ